MFVVLVALVLAMIPATQLYANGSLLGVCSSRATQTRPWRFHVYSLGHILWGLLGAACLLLGPLWIQGQCDAWAVAGCAALLVYPLYSVLRRRECKDVVVPVNNTSFAINLTEMLIGVLSGLIVALAWQLSHPDHRFPCKQRAVIPVAACGTTLFLLVIIAVRFVAMTGAIVDPAESCRKYLDKQV